MLAQPALAADPRFASNAARTVARDALRAIIVEAFADADAPSRSSARLDAAQIANARVNDDGRRLAPSAAAGARPLDRGRHAGRRRSRRCCRPARATPPTSAWTRCRRSARTPTRCSPSSASTPRRSIACIANRRYDDGGALVPVRPRRPPERYAKALASGADVVIVDLEDAVAAAAKESARSALAAWLDAGGSGIAVRINDAASAWFDADLALVARAGVAAVVVAKAERAADLARVRAAAPHAALLPLIETAAGIDRVREIANARRRRAARVRRDRPAARSRHRGASDGDELLAFRSQLVLASRLAGLDAPVDGVSTAIDDAEAVEADTRRARRLGFGAKLCIHPRQLAAVHAAFAPSADELAWAERVVAAAEAAAGAAVAVDGRMVDLPVLLRARALLARRR